MIAKSISILLVDDHKLFRYAIGRLIKTFPFNINLLEAANGKEAIKILASSHVDLVLLDIQMPEMGGIDTIKQLRNEGRQTKVIILTPVSRRVSHRLPAPVGCQWFPVSKPASLLNWRKQSLPSSIRDIITMST
ncbi:MAG: response regulator transcription factor [Bacteroidota bacterium]